jgi:hypothetical protein
MRRSHEVTGMHKLTNAQRTCWRGRWKLEELRLEEERHRRVDDDEWRGAFSHSYSDKSVPGMKETPLYVAVQGPTPAIPLDLVAGHCLDAVRLSIYGGRSVALAAIRPILKHGEVKEGATVAKLILLLPARLLFTIPFVVLVLAF